MFFLKKDCLFHGEISEQNKRVARKFDSENFDRYSFSFQSESHGKESNPVIFVVVLFLGLLKKKVIRVVPTEVKLAMFFQVFFLAPNNNNKDFPDVLWRVLNS